MSVMHSLLLSVQAPLFVPADRPDRYEKALSSGADAVIFDLEDAVAPPAKAGARERLEKRERISGVGEVLQFVRINSPLTSEGLADLEAATRLGADGLVVPKADLESVASAARAGLPLIALIETAAGVLAAPEIAAHAGVALLMLGPVDLSAELGITDEPAGDQLLAARSQLVLSAAAAGQSGPIDGPCLSVRDQQVLAAEIDRARRLGFAGKACIHPGQVGSVLAAFAPTSQEIDWARNVDAAFARAGDGVGSLDGQMIDRPVALRARRILDRMGRNAEA